jgi:phage terminase large subunit-like protein
VTLRRHKGRLSPFVPLDKARRTALQRRHRRPKECRRPRDTVASGSRADRRRCGGSRLSSGKAARERLFMAANRIGKTLCGAAEMSMHLTGLYPDWWDGRRFDKPIRAWAAGLTGESVCDVVQEKLIGPPMRKWDWGTGLIPKHLLGEVSVARGIADLIDSVSVKHISGGTSDLQFKSYASGREKWQGVGLEVCWMDEESPIDLYFEALTRTNETGGIVYTTFTPILGWSEVVRRFLTGET